MASECEEAQERIPSHQRYSRGSELCQALAERQKSITENYEPEGFNPMATYKEVGIDACIAVQTPVLLATQKGFRRQVKFCEHFIEDLFEIVSPKCTRINDGKVNDSNPCTALYGHISDQIIARPELDKVLFAFADVFTTHSSSEIGDNFDHYLRVIGKGSVRDTLLGLAVFSSYVTWPLIQEKLYKTKQYERLNRLALLFSRRFETFFPQLRPIYMGRQSVTIRGQTIGLSRKYHFFSALYVGCELTTRGYSDSIVQWAISGIGAIYESQDFLGHVLIDSVPWQESVDNFKSDTLKYRLGGQLATQLCVQIDTPLVPVKKP
jgi:hypothetical protein